MGLAAFVGYKRHRKPGLSANEGSHCPMSVSLAEGTESVRLPAGLVSVSLLVREQNLTFVGYNRKG